MTISPTNAPVQANGSRRSRMLGMLLAGGAYVLIGRLFAVPRDHVQLWRLAAWAASGAVYAVHIAYERFSLESASRSTALHVAAGVAVGALGLAIAGMMYRVSIGSAVGPRWLLALVLWPAFTALPAFVVALVAASLLDRIRHVGTAI